MLITTGRAFISLATFVRAMEWELTIFVVFAFACLMKIWSKKHQGNNGRLPPGPRRFPIVGNLHLLGKAPHRNLQELAKKYGPIMYMRFGFVPVVVISSPQAAEQILKTHDLIFASRPSHESSKYVSYDQRNLAFSSYGPYWRQMRKLCTLQLLIPAKIASFKDMRKEEVGILIKDIKKAASACTAVDVSAETASLTANIICMMVFGKKFTDQELDDRGFRSAIREGMRLTSLPNIADYIPQLAPFDLQGLRKRFKAISKVFDGFFEEIIDEHMASSRREKTKDFVDTMLEIMASQDTEFSIDRSNIKAIILDMLAAGMDTSATSVEWVMSELIKSPTAMKKLQKELENTVGLERMVEETDLESLEYLDMVVKETMRLHPPGPLLIPHKSTQECNINGFYIPKNTTVMVNAWTIGRDPSVWNDAEKFFPERFVGSNIDLRGHDFQLIPFGSGRRGCPGMQLGLTVVRLVVAQLVHCFNWELPENMHPDDLDMVEEFGLTIPRAKHLSAIPTYRLHN